jgi:hypothetical protein
MPLNLDKPFRWKDDVAKSIDFYNDWFLQFAPSTYRGQRAIQTQRVLEAFATTDNLKNIQPDVLSIQPGILPALRMSCAPPIARDRLAGLAHTSRSLIDSLEGRENQSPRLPPRFLKARLDQELGTICDVLQELLDRDLFPWLDKDTRPQGEELIRAASIVADRLCGAASDPIIRNAQEKRQLETLERWLTRRGYFRLSPSEFGDIAAMPKGAFAIRVNIPAGAGQNEVNI